MMRPTTVIPFPAPIVVSKGTTTVSKYIHSHIGGLKFEIGQAVWIAKFPTAKKYTMTPIPAVIVSMGQRLATVQIEAERKRVSFEELLPRGYCISCDRTAIVGDVGHLVCPRCGGDASATVPRERLPRFKSLELHSDLQYVMLTTGCTWGEAYPTARQYERERERVESEARRAQYEREREERKNTPSYKIGWTMAGVSNALQDLEPERLDATIAQIERLLETIDSTPAVQVEPHICDDKSDPRYGTVIWTDYTCGDDVCVSIPVDSSWSTAEMLGSGFDPANLDEIERTCLDMLALLRDPRVVAARAACGGTDRRTRCVSSRAA